MYKKKSLFNKVSMLVLFSTVLSACTTRSFDELITPRINKSYDNMYLRGVFNWWDATPKFKLNKEGDTLYSVTIDLIADGQPYDFKVADKDWTEILNCGTEEEEDPISSGDDITLYCEGDSKNIKFIPKETGTFIFTLDTVDNEEPELTIIRK